MPQVRTIGERYELCAELASGGMATVHLARQLGAAGFARIVAVKRLHERFARDPLFVAMFLDEARLVARIRHPNVVQTIDVVEEKANPRAGTGGELFIVMEYIHGESLSGALAASRETSEKISPRIAAAVLVGALHGLHEAHEARTETGEPLGIVHRDVSPHNILVGSDGVARVIDFGVAKATQRITSTEEGQLKGKLSYMSMEQVTNREVDRRTDLYAAAVVFWEVLAGRKLFQAASEAGVLQQVLQAAVLPPSAHHPEVSPALDAVILRGLAREPAARFATGLDFAAAITSVTPIASVAEVAAWVRSTCRASLAEKSGLIAEIESRGSPEKKRAEAASLQAVSGLAGDATVAPKRATSASDAPKRATSASDAPKPAADHTELAPAPSRTVVESPRVVINPGRALPVGASLSPRSPEGPPKRSKTNIALGVGLLASVCAAGGIYFELQPRNVTPVLAIPDAAPIDARADLVSASAADAGMVPPPGEPTCPDGMVRVPGGTFFMGTDDDDRAEDRPAHTVKLEPYCIDRFEVTTDAYVACSTAGQCKRAGTTNKTTEVKDREQKIYDPLCNASVTNRGTHPINCVDWAMAARFCKTQEKRLPSEAEWELAARGLDGRRFPWGDAPVDAKRLNGCGVECERWQTENGLLSLGTLHVQDDRFPTTAPVGSFPAGASPYGAEDMAGNVWEWVADAYAPYPTDERQDAGSTAEGPTRVIRGGAWNGTIASWVRTTIRYTNVPTARSHAIGFRCAKPL